MNGNFLIVTFMLIFGAIIVAMMYIGTFNSEYTFERELENRVIRITLENGEVIESPVRRVEFFKRDEKKYPISTPAKPTTNPN